MSAMKKPCGMFSEGMKINDYILDKWIATSDNDEKWYAHHSVDPNIVEAVLSFELKPDMASRLQSPGRAPGSVIIETLPQGLYQAGNIIGNWQLKAKLASEATGEVWDVIPADDNTTAKAQQAYVMKIATTEIIKKLDGYQREIKVLQQLAGSPGIMPLIDSHIAALVVDGDKACYDRLQPHWLVLPKMTLLIDTLNQETNPETIYPIILRAVKRIKQFLDVGVAYVDFKLDHLAFDDNQNLVLLDYGQCVLVDDNWLSVWERDKIGQKYQTQIIREALRALNDAFEQSGLSSLFIKPSVDKLLKQADTLSIDDFIQRFDKMITQTASPRFLQPCSEADLNAVLQHALHWYQAFETDKAKRTLQEILLLRPEACTVHHLLSMIALQQLQPQIALKHITKAINISDNPVADYYLTMGDAYQRLQDYDSAKQAYQKVLAINPHSPAALNNLGVLHLTSTNEKKAKRAQAIVDRQARIAVDESLKYDLLSVFKDSEHVNITSSKQNRLLVKGQVGDADSHQSYEEISWDQYFDDLSHGSYRDVFNETHRGHRLRTWHYLWKNLHIVDQIYNRHFALVQKQLGDAAEAPTGLSQHAIALASPQRILDIGCSSGYFRRFLEGNYSPTVDNQLFYYGVDIREEMLARAVHLTDDIESGADGNKIPSVFAHHDLQFPLNFKDQQFDYILNLECIKYLPVEVGRQLIKECHRCLKPGGTLYISTTSAKRHPGFIESLPYAEFQSILKAQGFLVTRKVGSQASTKKILSECKEAHAPLVKELLSYHPADMVATFLTPLYPHLATQVTFVCMRTDDDS